MTDENLGEVRDHLIEVGMVCTQWAYLEFLFEATIWWLLGIPNQKYEGRIITAGLSLEILVRKAADLSHLKVANDADLKTIQSIRGRISAIVDERNLAVHGLRSYDPENEITRAEVSRGYYKSKPQKISLIRLRSLNSEILSIMTVVEPLLVRYGVLDQMTDLSAQMQFLQQENKDP